MALLGSFSASVSLSIHRIFSSRPFSWFWGAGLVVSRTFGRLVVPLPPPPSFPSSQLPSEGALDSDRNALLITSSMMFCALILSIALAIGWNLLTALLLLLARPD